MIEQLSINSHGSVKHVSVVGIKVRLHGCKMPNIESHQVQVGEFPVMSQINVQLLVLQGFQ